MTFGAEAYYIMPVMRDLPFSARGLKLKNRTCHLPLSSVRSIFDRLDGDVGVRVIDQVKIQAEHSPRWKQAISFGDEGPPKKLLSRR
jgi:hypothetical protein